MTGVHTDPAWPGKTASCQNPGQTLVTHNSYAAIFILKPVNFIVLTTPVRCLSADLSLHNWMIGEHFNKTALLCHSLLAWFRYIFPNTPLLPSLESLPLDLRTAPVPRCQWHIALIACPGPVWENALWASRFHFTGFLAIWQWILIEFLGHGPCYLRISA